MMTQDQVLQIKEQQVLSICEPDQIDRLKPYIRQSVWFALRSYKINKVKTSAQDILKDAIYRCNESESGELAWQIVDEYHTEYPLTRSQKDKIYTMVKSDLSGGRYDITEFYISKSHRKGWALVRYRAKYKNNPDSILNRFRCCNIGIKGGVKS